MVENPPRNYPQITPYLHYRDLGATIEWLQRSFGFKVRFMLPSPKGGVMHAEMNYGDGIIMMGQASPEHGRLSPREMPGVNQGLYVYVEDLQRHYEHARQAGAHIVMEPEDMFWGDRVYAARDLEGHHWSFAQHVKDVPPEEMRPAGV